MRYLLHTIVLFTLAAFAAVSASARGTWTTYTNGNYINSVAVQGDYVWCGTSGGVVRWDKRDMSSVKFTTRDGLKSNAVEDITFGPDGTVWAAMRGGISFYQNGKWDSFPLPETINPEYVNLVAFAQDGSLWIGGLGYILHYMNGAWTSFRTRDIAPYCTGARSIAFGPGNSVWLGTNQGLCVYRDEHWERIKGPEVKLAFDMNKVLVTPEGAVWCCSAAGVSRYLNSEWTHFDSNNGMNAGWVYELAVDHLGMIYASGVRLAGIGGGLSGGGMYRYDGNEWKEIVSFGRDDVIHLVSVAIDSQNIMWVGASRAGLLRYDGADWQLLLTPDRLSYNNIHTMAIEPNGTLWLGVESYINRFDGSTWETYDRSGTPVPFNRTEQYPMITMITNSIAVTTAGDVWFAAWPGAILHRGSTWTIYDQNNGLPTNHVFSAAAGSNGDMWFGTDIGVARFDGNSWKTYTSADGLPVSDINSIAVGPSGEVWAGTHGNGVSRFDGTRWTSFKTIDGLADSTVNSIAVAPDGTAWFATQKGLSRYNGREWITFTSMEGLPNTSIRCVATTPEGVVWIGTDTGAAWFDGKSWGKYSVSDGLADNQVFSIAFAPDGAVWFGTAAGLSRLVPDTGTAVSENSTLPVQLTITGNYPNPFNSSTTISFSLSRSGNAELDVYSITGQKVRSLVSGFTPAGGYSVRWDGKNESGMPVSSGVYPVLLRAGEMASGHRMLLMK